MGEYANIKFKKFRNGLLKWLEGKGVTIKSGANHLQVECIHNGKKFPIPKKHNEVSKHIVKGFQKKLEEWNICTKEEFDKKI